MGHKRTIRPNAKKLSSIFMTRHEMDWDTFARKVRSSQIGFLGEPEEMRPGRGEFHEFLSQCVCKKDLSNNKDDLLQSTGRNPLISKEWKEWRRG